MSESKHTPGPWGIDRHRGDNTGPFLIKQLVEKKRGIAWEIDSEADAHLIAAAPDLLEAAQKVIDEAARMAMTTRRRTIFDNLAAAVAKAEVR